MPKTGDLSVRTLLEKPLAMDHKVAQDTGSAMRGIATLFGQLFVQLLFCSSRIPPRPFLC